ncbi:DUF1622 domain-containing protein [Candidatus Peribacteria bacterium]|nr:DUF1622 domain-containing protein [Candidatus Peribacteria bacterium]
MSPTPELTGIIDQLSPVILAMADIIGLIGLFIIVVGSVKAMYYFFDSLFTRDHQHHQHSHIRSVLGAHLILGLDFLVGKDVIDTLLIHSIGEIWETLASLVTVVGIRIVLTVFLIKELEKFQNEDALLSHIMFGEEDDTPSS